MTFFQWDRWNADKIEERYSLDEVEFALMFGGPVLVSSVLDERGELRRRVVVEGPTGQLMGIVYVVRDGEVRPLSAFPADTVWEARAFKKGFPPAQLE